MSNKIFLYHESCREGKLFDLNEAQARYEELVEQGWADTPAKLEPLQDQDGEDPGAGVEVTELTDEQLLQYVASRGLADQIGREITRDRVLELCHEFGIVVAVDAPQEPLINRFVQSPTSLSKDELKRLGADYGLSLSKTMSEQTMIGHVTDAIAAQDAQ